MNYDSLDVIDLSSMTPFILKMAKIYNVRAAKSRHPGGCETRHPDIARAALPRDAVRQGAHGQQNIQDNDDGD